MNPKNVALVLSSGGARGIAHIGAIDSLVERGYTITSIAGTSMGSLVGAIYANGNLSGFRDFLTSLTKMDVLRLMDLAVSKRGIIKGERVFGEIKQFIGENDIEDLPIPFTAIAADLFNHREVIFRHGNLMNALRASAAIPTVLLPLMQEKTLLVDGAIVNPLPINRVLRNTGDMLVAINVNAPRVKVNLPARSLEKRSYNKIKEFVSQKWNGKAENNASEITDKHGFFDIVSGSFEMMQYKLTESVLMRQPIDLLINLPINLADMFEFYRAGELIKIGYEATSRQLDNIESETSESPGIIEEWFI
jgi:NTE family protein